MSVWDTIDFEDVRLAVVVFLAIISLFYALWLRRTQLRLQQRISQLIRDPLTGLFSRAVFEEIYIRMYNVAFRRRFRTNGLRRRADTVIPDLTVLFFDLDHFKRVNDENGHLIGDKVLKIFAHLLAATTRPGDLVARWGGEEFMAVLETDKVGALVFLKRFLSLLKAKTFEGANGRQFLVTVTCGIASLEKEKEVPFDLLDRADRALLHGKKCEAGRDGYVIAQNGDFTFHKNAELLA